MTGGLKIQMRTFIWYYSNIKQNSFEKRFFLKKISYFE